MTTNDDIQKTSAFLTRIAKEGPQLKTEFVRAHDDEKRSEVESGCGSEQVEKDQPILKPQPTLGFGVSSSARSSHWSAASRDHERATQQRLEERKQAFLDRAAQKEHDEKGKGREID